VSGTTAKATLLVVASERHVERWARDGGMVETRARLRARLFDLLVDDRVAATAIETRLALAESLASATRDRLLAPMAREGGEAWERTVDAIDAAIGSLRSAGTHEDSLARIARENRGAAGLRARMLVDAMRSLDAALDARGLVDPRAVGMRLARVLSSLPESRVLAAVGAGSVVARFVLDWDGADAAWWRALDEALVRAGGEGASVELPSFESSDASAKIDAARENGPLDVLSEDVARALDAPPTPIAIDAPLGDLRLAGPPASDVHTRVTLRASSDAEGQARAVVDAVRGALARGCGIEEVAIGVPRFDEAAIGAIRRAFDEARIPLFDARGEAPIESGVVAFAMRALSTGAHGLSRLDVAALARARYVDARRLEVEPEALADLAYALERTPGASAEDARAALAATARASSPDNPARADARAGLALRLAAIVEPASRTMTRVEHVAAARAIFHGLGIDPLSARAFERALASDAPPEGVARAELRAVARDAHAWEMFHAALTDYETALVRLGIHRAVVAPHVFRHELARTLDARAGRPGAARAAAVRVAPLVDLAAEELGLLVVIEAGDGALPSRAEGDSLVYDSLAPALRAIEPAHAPSPLAVRAARELTALALAASSARAIVLTRRVRDEDGAAIAPSPIVAWLERGGVASSMWRASPLDGPAVSAREARLRHVARDDGSSSARRARIERTREARFEHADAPRDPILGDLESDDALPLTIARALTAETGGDDRALAVTSLERFATCSFQGFAQHVLRARRERPLREIPDARESGTLMHRALAVAFKATAHLWRERPRDAARIRTIALDECDGVLRTELLASPLRRLAFARVRDAVAATLEWSLADESWDFVRAEQSFGDGRRASWPALVLDDGDTRLALRGSIDRVDEGHGRAAVRAIDYKSSKRAAESGMRTLGDTAFQVALYARVAADALQAAERAGIYVPAPRPDDVGPKLKKDFDAKWSVLHCASDENAAITTIELGALDVVRRVRLGAIAPRPSDDAACTMCDSSGACRKPRFAIAREDDDGGAA
jgi:hypothetical protein